ncbi:MAG: hypothetical protein KF699_02295 [Phycisphaeraceae bacterium]|nr:hypothetical protein [Phycisphaeraceae bacterium]MBX3407543.1 hypothetical protein [Phycisphaeraceae bacterium]
MPLFLEVCERLAKLPQVGTDGGKEEPQSLRHVRRPTSGEPLGGFEEVSMLEGTPYAVAEFARGTLDSHEHGHSLSRCLVEEGVVRARNRASQVGLTRLGWIGLDQQRGLLDEVVGECHRLAGGSKVLLARKAYMNPTVNTPVANRFPHTFLNGPQVLVRPLRVWRIGIQIGHYEHGRVVRGVFAERELHTSDNRRSGQPELIKRKGLSYGVLFME